MLLYWPGLLFLALLFCGFCPSNCTGHLSQVNKREYYLPSNQTIRPSCSSTARAVVVLDAVALVGSCSTNVGMVFPTVPHSRCLKMTIGKSKVGQGRIEAILRQYSCQPFSQYTVRAFIKKLSLVNSFATALAKKDGVIASDGCKNIVARLIWNGQRIQLVD